MMKKSLFKVMSLLIVITVICSSFSLITLAKTGVTNKLITLSKTSHESCTDTGSIVFADGAYSFQDSNAVLGTGPITGSSVGNFTWEFDYWSNDPSWRQERFLFHSASDGVYETDTYCLEITGNGMYGGIRLFKNSDYDNVLASYKPEGGIKNLAWDGVKYRVKIEVKDNNCKIWFNETTATAGDPVITYDLGSDSLTTGDFKIQGYCANMFLDNMSIKTDTTAYYFEEADMPEDSGDDDNKGDDNKGDDNKGDDNKGDDSKGDDSKGDDNKGDDNKGDDNKGDDNKGDDSKGDDSKEESKNKLITLKKSTDASCVDTGSIVFANGVYSFKDSNDILGTGPITGSSVGDFTWQFDYWADDPNWEQTCFMFHTNSAGVLEENAYCLRIEGSGTYGGVRLYKNGDYNNPLASYKLKGMLKNWAWDEVKYRVKIEVKNNICKVWFYETTANAGNPVITYDLGSDSLTTGDFKIQGYCTKIFLSNMSIQTDSASYYFNEADMPKDSGNNGGSSNKVPATGETAQNGAIALLTVTIAFALAISCKRKRVAE